MLFRHWNPRVLGALLPVLDEVQLSRILGPAAEITFVAPGSKRVPAVPTGRWHRPACFATAPGMDRDEYPPAIFAERSAGSSVRLIPSSDSRSAGGQLQAQMNTPRRRKGARSP